MSELFQTIKKFLFSRKKSEIFVVYMEPQSGLEPETFTLPM